MGHYHSWWSRLNIVFFLEGIVHELPRALAIDVCHLGQAMIWSLVAFDLAMIGSSVGFARRISSTPEEGLDQQTTVLDLKCISWMFQTSPGKSVHLSTLKYLMTMTALGDFDPTRLFGVFIGRVNLDNHNTVIHELGELATISAVFPLDLPPSFGYGSDFRCPYRPPPAPRQGFSFRAILRGSPILPSARGRVQAAEVEYQKNQH